MAADVVEATLPHLSRQVQTMVRLQLLTGMRAGEVVLMRAGDIDRAERPDGLWTFRPFTHKNKHRGHDRIVPLGPRARELISPFLKLDPEAFIFSPFDAEAERREAASAARRTPASCGNTRGTNRVRKPKRKPGDSYDVDAYRRAIARACDVAFPPTGAIAQREGETAKEWHDRLTPQQRQQLKHWRREHRWSPLQLRHSAATRIRHDHGFEAAQVLLGHHTNQITQRYAERNVAAAEKVMAEAG